MAFELKNTIAEFHKVSDQNIFVINNKDALAHSLTCFAKEEKTEICTTAPIHRNFNKLVLNDSISINEVTHDRVHEKSLELIPGISDIKFNVGSFVDSISESTALTIVSDVLYPLGRKLEINDIFTIADKCKDVKSILILDCTHNLEHHTIPVELLNYKNLLMVHSVKQYGLDNNLYYVLADAGMINILRSLLDEVTCGPEKEVEYLLRNSNLLDSARANIEKTKTAIVNKLVAYHYEVVNTVSNYIMFNNLIVNKYSRIIDVFPSSTYYFSSTPFDSRTDWLFLHINPLTDFDYEKSIEIFEN